jgi:hypothetical protein
MGHPMVLVGTESPRFYEGEEVLHLQYISIPGDHLVQHRVYEKA